VPKTEAIADQNSVEVPLYTPLDITRYLRIPLWVTLAVSGRHRDYPKEVFYFFSLGPVFQEQIKDDFSLPFRDAESKRVSFRTLANIFLLSFLFRYPTSSESRARWHPRDGQVFFDLVWEAFRYAESDPGLFTDPNPDVLLKQFEKLVTRFIGLERIDVKKLIALHLERVELKNSVPIRLYPLSRDPAPDAPRLVVIDPEVRFGRPTVKGVPTDVLAERWRAGDRPPYLADDYSLTIEEVEEALRYESTPHTHAFQFPFFGW
jgi:uncharacterized protein (DUF433 family)